MDAERRVTLYDTTLRDGMQQEGMSVSADEKVRIAVKLDELGVHYIEGGFPASNPKELAFFERMRSVTLHNAELVAFGTTRRRGVKAEDDAGLRLLAEVWPRTVTIVGKTWGLHLTQVLHVTRDENLRMIADSVRFLVGAGKQVIYDAEHFFDAYAEDADYALATALAAADAGAAAVCLCDTNGAALPAQVAAVIADVDARIVFPVGVHVHNDSDCAVANSLIAVASGATQVQGTVNGYGERCGNANLISIIPALALKMGLPVVSAEQLEKLTETAHFVSGIVNVPLDSHRPYVGRMAFAHKGGLHVAAVQAASQTFEHVDPQLVGNEQRILISELSGKGAVLRKAHEMGLGLDADDDRVAGILRRLKDREHKGFQYEAADGSFELFLRQTLAPHEPYFRLESFRVIVEKREDGKAVVEATIKVHVGEERIISTAEGNGPVNALDAALRKAIMQKYPRLNDIELVNYRVRILDEAHGTGAVTRVLLDASDGDESWGTTGVSENIIEASWQALVDSIEYGLLHGEARGAANNERRAASADADPARGVASARADIEAGGGER
jgi:2-isopropylmalate synthase